MSYQQRKVEYIKILEQGAEAIENVNTTEIVENFKAIKSLVDKS